MHVLFIGGTGNISTECAAQLRMEGHRVTVLTRGRTPAPDGCAVIKADRSNPESMRNALAGVEPEVVIDFIAYEPQDARQDFQLFQGRVRQFIFISSTTAYARPAILPISEDAPLGNPWWYYARKKIACEAWLRAQWETENFPVTIVRPSHTYSHMWVPNAISSGSFTVARRLETGKPIYIHDKGESRWTLTAASDFALGLAGLVGNDAAIGESFHITSDEVLTWNQVYAEIASALGVVAPPIVHIPADFICQIDPAMTGTLKGDKAHPGVFDNAKLKRFVPGFTARKTFREGVCESVAWLRAHPEHQKLKPELETRIETVLGAWEKARS